jgi:transposase InsO family protein
MKNVVKRKAEAVAEERLRLISPLIEPDLDRAMISERMKEIAEKYSVSYRTLGRYLRAYQEHGFEGLKPKAPQKKGMSLLPSDYPELLEEAIILRRECPTRSVSDIIKILELEGRVKPGVLKRSTLQRHLQESGYSKRQMMMYQKTGKAARRFQKRHRCELWQSDVKYGPYLPIGEGRAKKQVYLCTIIDDATRYIVAAGFYSNQSVEMIESCLRQAVMRFGKPDVLYLDNGKIYRSEWLKRACVRLGIKIVYTKPYSPEAHGKAEAFNRRADAFLSEVALQKCETLDELNHYLEVWIDGYYHKNNHSGLGNISPVTAFSLDPRPLQFVSDKALRETFLHTEERLVDKTGCISFNGKQYEVGIKLMGQKVEVLYDPACTDQIEIHHRDFEPFFAKPLEIGPFCGVRKEIPEEKKLLDAESSRLLEGLDKTANTKRTSAAIATSFRRIREVDDNV